MKWKKHSITHKFMKKHSIAMEKTKHSTEKMKIKFMKTHIHNRLQLFSYIYKDS